MDPLAARRCGRRDHRFEPGPATGSGVNTAPAIPPWWRELAWLALLALMPWWLGLPLLLAIVATLLIPSSRLIWQAPVLRRALRWGLPGMLLALQRGLGGDALAWGAALLGALAGFTLLAGLEAWLDRGQRRRDAVAVPAMPEWPASASFPEPPATIIELARPRWRGAGRDLVDPRGGLARWHATTAAGGHWQLGDGRHLDDALPRACFSPDGCWFATLPTKGRGLLLLDRERDRLHRLRGWKLCGWHAEQPWLMRNGQAEPMPLREVLGQLRYRW